MYQIQFTKFCEKQFKKLPKKIQDEVYDWSEELQVNPFPKNSKTLTGNWKGVVSLHFHRRPEYRLLYFVVRSEYDYENESGTLTILTIATREQMNRIYKVGKKKARDILNSSIDMYR